MGNFLVIFNLAYNITRNNNYKTTQQNGHYDSTKHSGIQVLMINSFKNNCICIIELNSCSVNQLFLLSNLLTPDSFIVDWITYELEFKIPLTILLVGWIFVVEFDYQVAVIAEREFDVTSIVFVN